MQCSFRPYFQELVTLHKNNWHAAYEASKTHPLREEALQHASCQTLYLHSYPTALWVFSYFAKISDLSHKKKEGVEKLRAFLALEKRNPSAIFCTLAMNATGAKIHSFILEKTLDQKLYIYQSFTFHYTLGDSLENLDKEPLNKKEFLKGLSVITDEDALFFYKAREFKKFFHADLALFSLGAIEKKLPFYFQTLDYTMADIPTSVPKPVYSLKTRIKNNIDTSPHLIKFLKALFFSACFYLIFSKILKP